MSQFEEEVAALREAAIPLINLGAAMCAMQRIRDLVQNHLPAAEAQIIVQLAEDAERWIGEYEARRDKRPVPADLTIDAGRTDQVVRAIEHLERGEVNAVVRELVAVFDSMLAEIAQWRAAAGLVAEQKEKNDE